jgi:hypothetical protein
MSKPVFDNEATPKAVPNASRHDTETVMHDPKDPQQTEAAKESARIDATKNQKAGPDSRGERR